MWGRASSIREVDVTSPFGALRRGWREDARTRRASSNER
jgi:hypothetical protein